MTELTLFTAPKPFTDARISRIQTNALLSWAQLPDVDILVMGEGDGIDVAAAKYGATWLPQVRRNSLGTPLISSMIELARSHSRSKLLCLINTDMILMRDLQIAVAQVAAQLARFLLLGRRWDLDVDELLEFSEGWEPRLRAAAAQHGTLHRPSGSDFFVFPRDLYGQVPDFAVGRAGWDNWMIFAARRNGIPVIDCTTDAMVVHQNHDYRHLPGGTPHYGMPESDENVRLAGGPAAIRYTVLDSTHCLQQGRLTRPPMSNARLLRNAELLVRRLFFFLPQGVIESIARPRRWQKRWRRVRQKRNYTGAIRKQ